MTALSADANLTHLGELHLEKFFCDTSGSWTAYKGGGIIIDQSVDTLLAHTAESITAVDGDVFLGIAWEKKVIVSGDPETTEIDVAVEPSIVGFKSTVLTSADLGKPVYMSDTGTLSASNGAYPRIGNLFKVQDGRCYVQLRSPYVLDVP